MDRGWGVAGADTHKESITFAVVDATGADVDVASFDVTTEGVGEIIRWLRGLSVEIARVGIEGSAGWGLPVSKALVVAGFDVREVNPSRTSDRRRRRRRQKTDREDAMAVAREVLADPSLPPAGSSSARLRRPHRDRRCRSDRRSSAVPLGAGIRC